MKFFFLEETKNFNHFLGAGIDSFKNVGIARGRDKRDGAPFRFFAAQLT